jgi:hypothetical protein
MQKAKKKKKKKKERNRERKKKKEDDIANKIPCNLRSHYSLPSVLSDRLSETHTQQSLPSITCCSGEKQPVHARAEDLNVHQAENVVADIVAARPRDQVEDLRVLLGVCAIVDLARMSVSNY